MDYLDQGFQRFGGFIGGDALAPITNPDPMYDPKRYPHYYQKEVGIPAADEEGMGARVTVEDKDNHPPVGMINWLHQATVAGGMQPTRENMLSAAKIIARFLMVVGTASLLVLPYRAFKRELEKELRHKGKRKIKEERLPTRAEERAVERKFKKHAKKHGRMSTWKNRHKIGKSEIDQEIRKTVKKKALRNKRRGG